MNLHVAGIIQLMVMWLFSWTGTVDLPYLYLISKK